jgi:cytochrome P450/NADPH-cytochrome P450 reductase
MTEAIPQPKAWPIIGNLLDLQDDMPLHALERLGDIYGQIFKFQVRDHETIVVTSYDLFNELCDETRFWKIPPKALVSGIKKGPSGLFTAASEKEDDWQQAHRILMPAFGPMAIEDMFDGD